MKKAKGRVSSITSENRRRDMVKLASAGVTNKQIAKQLGITAVSVSRNLTRLREMFGKLTKDDYDAYRAIHRKVLLLIEQSLLEGKLPIKIASEWRQIRSDIAVFDGLNAPAKSIGVTVPVSLPGVIAMDFSAGVEKTANIVTEAEYMEEQAEAELPFSKEMARLKE